MKHKAAVDIKVNDEIRPAESAMEVSWSDSAARKMGGKGEWCWRCQAVVVGLEGEKRIGQSRTEECNLHRWGVTGGKKG